MSRLNVKGTISSTAVLLVIFAVVASVVAASLFVSTMNTQKAFSTQGGMESEKVAVMSALGRVEITPNWLIVPDPLWFKEVTLPDGSRQVINAKLSIYEFSSPGMYIFKTREALILAYTDLNSTAYAVIIKPSRPITNSSILNASQELLEKMIDYGSAYVTYWQSNVQLRLPSGQVINIQLVPLVLANVPPWGKTRVKLVEPSYGFIADCKPFTNVTEVLQYINRKEVTIDKIDCLAVPKDSRIKLQVVEGVEKHVGYGINGKVVSGREVTFRVGSSTLADSYFTKVGRFRIIVKHSNVKNKVKYTCSWDSPAGTFTWSGRVENGKTLTLPVGTVCSVSSDKYANSYFKKGNAYLTSGNPARSDDLQIKVYDDDELIINTYPVRSNVNIVVKVEYRSWPELTVRLVSPLLKSTNDYNVITTLAEGNFRQRPGTLEYSGAVYNNVVALEYVTPMFWKCNVEIVSIDGAYVLGRSITHRRYGSYIGKVVFIPSTSVRIVLKANCWW